MSVAFLTNAMSNRARWRKRLSLSSSQFPGAVKKSPILTVSPTTSTLLNSGQLSVFILLDLSAWNCTLNSKFIYPTSHFNSSTWDSSRHLRLHMFNIKFLLISLSPLPPNSFHAQSFSSAKPIFPVAQAKNLDYDYILNSFFCCTHVGCARKCSIFYL